MLGVMWCESHSGMNLWWGLGSSFRWVDLYDCVVDRYGAQIMRRQVWLGRSFRLL